MVPREVIGRGFGAGEIVVLGVIEGWLGSKRGGGFHEIRMPTGSRYIYRNNGARPPLSNNFSSTNLLPGI